VVALVVMVAFIDPGETGDGYAFVSHDAGGTQVIDIWSDPASVKPIS